MLHGLNVRLIYIDIDIDVDIDIDIIQRYM